MPKKKKTITISLKNVTKTYEVHHEKPTFVENVVRRGGRNEKYTALDNLSLDIYKGERVGIIGPNGAGKTTLLKTIVGITTPTSGTVKTKGKIVSLIDLTAGFHPDLTGEENIFLNGLIIGMSKEEVREKFNDIVKFADIGDFIDTHMYKYSEGMKLRLGFAVAVHSNPDILILDEGMAVGDEKFREKARKKINSLFRQKKTVVIASHWMEFLRKSCDRVVWIEGGRVVEDGGVGVLEEYK